MASRTRIGYPDKACGQLDYEAEPGVIIGKPGLGISRADAPGRVSGTTA